MDEKGVTQLYEVAPVAVSEPELGAPPAMYLIVLSGGIPGAMLALDAGANWIGRAADNSIQMPESSISRHHALLKTDEDGRVVLTDLGSTNGTFVNGQSLRPNQPVPLNDGDRVRIGTMVVVKFVRPDSDEERFQREMFERTVRDPLTGLYNRSYFFDRLLPLVQGAASRDLGTSVLMLDIDHFKTINDTHGHDAGDAVLREVADVLRQSTRSEDLVARYGGEEFVLALPAASLDRALERAERIRKGIAARRYRVRDEPLRVTASIGIAFVVPGRPRPASALVSAADLNLYRAKESGRDRVVCDLNAPPGSIPEGQATHDGEGDVTPISVAAAMWTDH